MTKEAIGVGATLEEAMEKAKAELNASFDDEIQFEVLAEPKKKALGLFGGSQAKVRVFIETPDPVPAKKKEKKSEAKPEKKAEVKPEKKAEPKPEKKAEPKPEKKAEPKADAKPESEFAADTPIGRSIAYLRTILKALNVENVEIFASETENGANIMLEGENLGIVIGRRGETLDALQYLTSLAANAGDSFFRVTLDTGDYRAKREQTLESLARRVSSQVLRTGRSRALEPMNPYERRIIHTAVQGIDGVESNSTGEGRSRRVVISPVGGERRDNRQNRSRRPSGEIKPAVDREPKRDLDLPLYGKID